MKYQLILGIIFEKYKDPAKIDIFLDDTLLDSFELDQDYPATDQMLSMIERRWIDVWKPAEVWQDARWRNRWLQKPRFFKVYEIDEEKVKGSVRLDVSNSNSNYTNGFMSKSSIMKLGLIALFPKPLCLEQGRKLTEIICRFHKVFDRILVKNKEFDFENHTTWPFVSGFHLTKKDNKHKKQVKNALEWLGGSFTVTIPIKIKHRVKYLASASRRSHGFWFPSSTDGLTLCTCKPLLNTYSDENK